MHWRRCRRRHRRWRRRQRRRQFRRIVLMLGEVDAAADDAGLLLDALAAEARLVGAILAGAAVDRLARAALAAPLQSRCLSAPLAPRREADDSRLEACILLQRFHLSRQEEAMQLGEVGLVVVGGEGGQRQ